MRVVVVGVICKESIRRAPDALLLDSVLDLRTKSIYI